MFEVPNLDDETDRDWTVFAAELADILASAQQGAELSISPRFQSQTATTLEMRVRTTTNGTMLCTSTGLQSPPSPWQLSDGDHTLEDEQAWVDRFTAALVVQIRRTWNVPHPSFLSGVGAERKSGPPEDLSLAHTHSTEAALEQSLAVAARRLPNAEVQGSGDGTYSITVGSVVAYAYVASSDEVRFHAPLVERIEGRTRAAEVIADLNRRHPRMKFLLVEDRVHVAVSVDADPFVPRHAVNAITRLTALVSSVDDAFADNLGGFVAPAGPSNHDERATFEDDREVSSEEDVPASLMTLLEMDARSGGAVGPQHVISVCGADRTKISRYETFCAEQAASWREYADEAVVRGESEEAADCEAEAVPWDRIVHALRGALKDVGFFDNA